MSAISIRAGGQSGVDRAALDFALARGLNYGGWCPRGGWAEDYPVAPGLLAKYPRLTETPSDVPEQRTAWNVRDSHATLILVHGDELNRSPGSLFAKQAAEFVFVRPYLVVELRQSVSVDCASEWLAGTIAALDVPELLLHIAGPRESQAPGIYAETGGFLAELFAARCKR
jgi:Circularly permutated YpsA SLOG family